MRTRGGPGGGAALTRGRVRPFGVRAAVVLAVLAGLFGMHGLGAGHASMTMDAPVTSSHAMVEQLPVRVLPGSADTARSALVSVLSGQSVLPGQSGAGGPEHSGHTGMTSMTCVAVLTAAASVALALLLCRRVLARRRARPSWPAPVHAIARRVVPRVAVRPRALTLSQLCVMRV